MVTKSAGKAKYELSEADLKKHGILGKKDSTATMFLRRHLKHAAIEKFGSEAGLVNLKNRKLMKKAVDIGPPQNFPLQKTLPRTPPSGSLPHCLWRSLTVYSVTKEDIFSTNFQQRWHNCPAPFIVPSSLPEPGCRGPYPSKSLRNTATHTSFRTGLLVELSPGGVQ